MPHRLKRAMQLSRSIDIFCCFFFSIKAHLWFLSLFFFSNSTSFFISNSISKFGHFSRFLTSVSFYHFEGQKLLAVRKFKAPPDLNGVAFDNCITFRIGIAWSPYETSSVSLCTTKDLIFSIARFLVLCMKLVFNIF